MNLDQALAYARDVGLTDRQIAVVVRQEADRVRFKVDTGKVTLTHPETGHEYDANPEEVDQLALSGWVAKEDLPTAAPADETPEETPANPRPRKAK